MLNFLKKLASPFSKLHLLFSKAPNDETFERLEQIFYEADLGAETASELALKIRKFYRKTPEVSIDEILEFVKKELLKGLITHHIEKQSPHIILVVGVNGSGKTTTLVKLASYYMSQGKKVLIAAGDTFRAAAIEQLEIWSKKLGTQFLKSRPNCDPSGVVFDALAAAKARDIDIVLIDTAGRLQTKTNLMQELAKIRKVCQKQIPNAPHETLFVVDATIGQNAIDQAKTFHQFTPISGIALTKLDGSAKGGIAIAIQKQLQIPIQWIGLGETLDDLIPFNAEEYVDSLF